MQAEDPRARRGAAEHRHVALKSRLVQHVERHDPASWERSAHDVVESGGGAPTEGGLRAVVGLVPRADGLHPREAPPEGAHGAGVLRRAGQLAGRAGAVVEGHKNPDATRPGKVQHGRTTAS